MTDLDAAGARHADGAEPALCRHDPLNRPCDFAQAIAALDAAEVELSEWKALAADIGISRTAARDLADELLDLYIRSYCVPEKFWDCGDPFCVEARERLPVAALAKWEASRNHSETPKGSTDAKWEASK